MPRQQSLQQSVSVKHQQLQALCMLSNTPQTAISPEKLSNLINNAPDPETAVREVLDQLPAYTDALEEKWRSLVVDLWTDHHPNVPVLGVSLPVDDVTRAPIVADALTYLRLVKEKPVQLSYENKEWLVAAQDAYYLATQLPSRGSTIPVQLENEWQYHNQRRLREVLEALRLVRRIKGQLIIVKSRYERFIQLPINVQYYLLWHAETYHTDWGQFAGIWSEYLRIVQEYLPLLWSMSEDVVVDMPQHIRRWNQEIWETYHPLWEQEGLLSKHHNNTALMSLVRVHSLPTALNQVILRDLFEPYGLIYGEGEYLSYTSLGYQLFEAERTQDLPCALDLLK